MQNIVEDTNKGRLKATFLDRVVGYISPKAGLERVKARRSYEAASFGRRTKAFKNASSTGPNLEIAQSFQTLRNRSRHFVRNNGWAKRALGVITDNTIGQGIRPAPVGTGNQVKKIKAIWHDWAETTACDWYGKNTFYGLQQLIMSEISEAGDCLIIRRKVMPDSNNPLPIKLQILEGDQLDHNRNYRLSVNIKGKELPGYARLGVQFDDEGRLLGYWVWPQHPYDMSPVIQTIASEFVPVEDVIHPFEILRIGQVRGIPDGVAAFMKMSDFSDYEDAQLMRQKVAAAFAAFVTGRSENASDDPLEHMEPGIIEYLNENETITFSSPPKADGYSEYSKKILQGIAASYEITYEQLTMDYSNVNYTSGQMARQDTKGRFRKLQYNLIVPQVCVPVWGWFMEAVQITGKMLIPVVCNAMDWTAPKIAPLDYVKETNARIAAISAGLTTWSEVIREEGRDKDEFLEEYKRDMEDLKKAGVNFTSVQMVPPETKIAVNE